MKKTIRKIKFFFDTVVKSLSKFTYYKEIIQAKFSFSLKYLFFLFYTLSAITSIVFAASISILVLPKVPSLIAGFSAKADSLYPADLIINIKNGIISTNRKEPYAVDTLNSLGLSQGYDHVLVIDTNADPANIKDDKTLALVTRDSIVITDNSSYKVYPIDNTANYTIDKNGYRSLLSKITPSLKYVEPALITFVIIILVVWPFIAAALSLVAQLIYLLIFTAIFFLATKLMKKNIPYKKLYQLAMHAATLPILLGFIASSVGIQIPFLLGTAILFVFMILVVNQF